MNLVGYVNLRLWWLFNNVTDEHSQITLYMRTKTIQRGRKKQFSDSLFRE